MKKSIILSLIVSLFLQAELIRSIPINKNLLSEENGGSLSAIEAYSDGVGLITASNLLVDNNALNTLVFKYGKQAKDANLSLIDYVNSNVSDPSDLQLLNDIVSNVPNGSSCNDNNVETINDIYYNGSCIGTNVPNGSSCNDNNIQTINDVYISGLCVGNNVEGQSCNDNNIQTINDLYHNGICLGNNVEGQSCNDGNSNTSNDVYVNGICKGTNLLGIGNPCDDGNPITTNDKYVNNTGGCIGSIPNTISCDDGDPNTYNDIEVYIVAVGQNSSSAIDGCAGLTLTGISSCDDHNILRATNNDTMRIFNGIPKPSCVGYF